MQIRTLFSIFAALAMSTTVALAAINIEASINPSTVSVGEPFQLSVTVSGAGKQAGQPKIPDLDEFRHYSQGHSEEISFINGQMSSRTVYTFVMIPNTAGTFTIPSVEVPIDGKTYKTGRLDVRVTESTSSGSRASQGPSSKPPARVIPPSSSTLPPEYNTGQEIFVRVWVDKDEVYVNEPVYMTYTVYTRASATFKGFEDEPVTTGFWVEEFPPQGLQSRHEKVIGRYRYVIADVRTLALFPNEAGEYTINPGSLKVDVEIRTGDPFRNFPTQSLFGRRVQPPSQFFTQNETRVLQTDSIKIRVLPFPKAGMPDSFNGAVGHYTLESSIDMNQVEERQPVTVRMRVSGEGNLNTLEMPKLSPMNDFKFYDSSSKLDLRKDRYIVEGEKVSETVLVPRKVGAYTIRPVEFSYFDPAKKKYVTLKTKAHQLSVKESSTPVEEDENHYLPPSLPQKNVDLVGEDIRFIKTKPDRVTGIKEPLILKKSFWMMNAGMLVLALVVLIMRGLADMFSRGGSARLGAGMTRQSRKKLKSAGKHLKSGQEKQFFEDLSDAVYRYFAEKLKMEVGAVGVTTIEPRLSAVLSPDEWNEVRTLFSDIDYGRFSASSVSLEEMKQLFAKTNQVISVMEKKRL